MLVRMRAARIFLQSELEGRVALGERMMLMLEWYVGSIGGMAINDNAGCEMAKRFDFESYI